MQDKPPAVTAATGSYKKFFKLAMSMGKRWETKLRLQKPPQSYQATLQCNNHHRRRHHHHHHYCLPDIHMILLIIIKAISIAPLQVHYYSEALPTIARILYRSLAPKRTGNCR